MHGPLTPKLSSTFEGYDNTLANPASVGETCHVSLQE